MRNRILKSFSPIHALLFCTSVLLASAAAAGDLEQENSQANGVSISVKPVDVSAANWQFEVALNTHGGSLDDDLTKTATLLAAGRQYPAAGWDGRMPRHMNTMRGRRRMRIGSAKTTSRIVGSEMRQLYTTVSVSGEV